MCLNLMQGDFFGAMESNRMLFFLSPFFLLVGVHYLIRYIRTGLRTIPAWQNIGLYLAIGLLIFYSLLRNLALFFPS